MPFTRVLNAARRDADDPEAFAFWPESWIIPEEEDAIPELAKWRERKRERKNKRAAPVFIYKPNGGNQGDGILLLATRRDLARKCAQQRGTDECALVQRYLGDPLLLPCPGLHDTGYKFDLRLCPWCIIYFFPCSCDRWLTMRSLPCFCFLLSDVLFVMDPDPNPVDPIADDGARPGEAALGATKKRRKKKKKRRPKT